MRHPPAIVVAVASALLACAHLPTEKERELAKNYYDQGVLAVKAGRPQEALSLFDRSIAEDPDLAQPHAALGLIYWWSFSRPAQAKVELEKALALDPHFAEAANNLGTLLTELKDYEGAQRAFDQALSEPLYRTPYVAQVNLGWLSHLKGRDAQAEQLIRAALSAEPGYCVGHRELARLLVATGRKAEADGEWAKFAELCPDDPEALLHGAALKADQGDPVGAARELEKCLERAGEKPVAKDCRAALSRLPPLPPEAALPKGPPPIVPGTKQLDDAAGP